MRPDVVLRLAGETIQEPTPYLRTRKAAQTALESLRLAASRGEISFSNLQTRWLERLSCEAASLPEDEDKFIAGILPQVDRTRINLGEYEIIGADPQPYGYPYGGARGPFATGFTKQKALVWI